jgi:hypothetical protein
MKSESEQTSAPGETRISTKKRKGFLQLGIISALFIIFATFFRSCIYSVVNPPNWKVATISIPEKQITISLYFGSRQEAFIQPNDGVYRILAVSQQDKPTKYYDISSLITLEGCRTEIYWYPTNNLVRFKDTELTFAKEFRSECLLDLNQSLMFAVVRGNGVTHTAKLSFPRDEMNFPQSHNEGSSTFVMGS